ncbi:MAG: copper resistance protein CopC [Pseudomonadota bacterium]
MSYQTLEALMKFLINLIATVAVFSVTVVPAFAHTSIVSSNIEDGSQIEAAPASFDFSFGADIGLAGLELETLDGDPVEIAFERTRETGKSFSVPLPMLESGTYVLKWRAVAKDGHVMKGEVVFTITG